MFAPEENIKLNNFTIIVCLYYTCGYIISKLIRLKGYLYLFR
jgi:hypothetical protein